MIPAIPSGVIGEGRLSCELAVGLPGELRHRAQPSLPHSVLECGRAYRRDAHGACLERAAAAGRHEAGEMFRLIASSLLDRW